MDKSNNGLKGLWTAETANAHALFGMWHWGFAPIWDLEDLEDEQGETSYEEWAAEGDYIECTVPDAETAKFYIEARHIRECYFGGMPGLLDREYTWEEVESYSKKERMFQKMHLDMRDQTFVGDNGKVGLRDVCGNVLVEPQFDDFPERYSCFERINLIPVVLDGRHYLYNIRERKLQTKDYDRIFRYFWSYIDYFVAEENGKKGILAGINGKECTPVIMDEIYDMLDPDGAVPFEKDGKIGFVWGDTYTSPIFDDVRICSEEYTKVLLNGEWGWIGHDGKFTRKKSEASFGSWYDSTK